MAERLAVDSRADRGCHGRVHTPQNQLCRARAYLFGTGLVLVSALSGCRPAPSTSDALHKQDTRGLEQSAKLARSESPIPPSADSVAARVDNEPVPWSALRPQLEEAAGGTVLRDLALDLAIGAECEARKIKVARAEVDAEQSLLMQTVERDTAAQPAEALSMLDSIRRGRGLGEVRFRALLERNARLRALVRDSINVTDSEVEQASLIRYGPRYRIRVIVVATQHVAADLRAELVKASALDVAFARAALLKSTDPSAVRGGLTDPISPVDQVYPEAIRKALATLEPNTITPVIGIDSGFAICMLDSRVPESERPQGSNDAIRDEIKRRKERLAMEDLARRLLARVNVAPLDSELAWSWETITRQR